MKLKRFGFKVVLIELIVLIVFISVNFTLLGSIIETNIKFTSEIQSEQISKILKGNIEILKNTNENMAKNTKIIEILENNKNIDDI